MVAIPSSSPTLVSSVSIFSASSAPPSSHSHHKHIQYNNHNHNRNHNHNNNNSKNNKNNNTNQVAPSSPDSSCSNSCASSPRFPCLDPISGRTLSHTSSGHISSYFQRPIISTSTSTPNKMQRSSPSSSIPSPPEHNIHYYNSSLLVKGPHPSSTSLDHVFPNPRTKTLGPDDRSSSDYYNHRRMHSNNNNNNNSEDDDASSVVVDHHNNNKNGSHSRIDIANLLCTSGTTPSSNGPTRNTTTSNNSLPPPPPPHTTNVNSNVHGHHDPKSLSQQQQQQQQQQQGLRAITEEADDHEVSPHHRYRQLPSYPDSRNGNHTSGHYNNSNGNANTNGSYSSTSTGSSREPLTQRVVAVDAPGAAPSSASYYRPPTSSSTSSSASHVGARPASFSAGSTSSSSSGPLYSSGGSSSSSSSAAIYTSAPSRSKLPGPQQRSASWNTDRYQDYGQGHSSTTSYEQEQQRRTDRSKSDYALHQQNYGPYLDSSPPLSAATLPRSNGTTTSSSSSLNSAPPSSSSVKMPASGAEPPASLYYQQPQPQQQQQSQPQAPPSQQAQHQQQHSQQQPSASTPALSSSPSAYYSNVPSNGGHGTPNTVRSLSAVSMASSSSRSMRDYPHAQSSDSSANEQLRRPTLPPPSALLSGADVKPARIYGRDSTAEDLWSPHPRPSRVVPIDAPNEKRPYSFDNSAMLPPVLPPPTSSAPSSSSSSSLLPYSSGYSNGSMEQKQRRIYGIDAADVPSRFAAPPPLPSSYGSNGHYAKRPQDSSDGIEGGESRKRVFGRDSADTYQQRPYGSNTTAPSSSAPSYGGTPSYGYNAPPPPPQPSVSQSHHYSSSDMDRSSRHEEYKHRGWSNGQPPSSSSSSVTHGGPAYGSSVPTSSSRAYPRAQSPDIKPPSWYQDYANSVLPKPQTQPAYQQQRSDSGYYGGSNHHYQQQQHHHHSSSHGYGKSSSLAGIHEMEEDEDGNLHRSSKSSKRSKTGMGSSPSVHPFDNADPNSTSSSSSKSKKPKRIKNAAGQEDMIVMDDEFYAVKAKRKRANASQLSVLNAAFERSYFPSTEERLRLSKQCRMCPRTVQIWFQNKRQSVKARSEAMEAAVNGTAITDELLESRLQMLEEESNGSAGDGQKRSTGDMIDEDFEGDEESGPGEHADHSANRRHHHHSSGSGSGSGSSKPRRSSGNPASGSSNGNGHLTPSDAVMSALHIQLDGRSVDYFSRKRRATIAKMERNEQQKKEKEELQRKREQEQQLIIQQYQKHQQEQLQQQRLQQQQQEGQTVGHN